MTCIVFWERKGGDRCCRQIISQFCFQPEKVLYCIPDDWAASISSPSFLKMDTEISLPTQNIFFMGKWRLQMT